MTTNSLYQFISNTCSVLDIFQVPSCLVDKNGVILCMNKKMDKDFNILFSTDKQVNISILNINPDTLVNSDKNNLTIQHNDETYLLKISYLKYSDEQYYVISFNLPETDIIWQKCNVRSVFIQAVDQMQESIFLTDLDGKIIFANKEMCARTGKELNELVSVDYRDFFPDDRERATTLLQEAIAGENDLSLNAVADKTTGKVYTTKCIQIKEHDVLVGLLFISVDITLKQTKEKVLNKYIELEKSITGITRMLYDSNDINKCLAEIGKTLDVCRVTLFDFMTEEKKWQDSTFEWSRKGVPSVLKQLKTLNRDPFIWGIKEFRKNNIIVISDVDALPPKADFIKNVLKETGVKAHVVIPLFWKNDLLGLLCFDETRSIRDWTEFEIVMMQMFSDVIRLYFNRMTLYKELEVKEHQYRHLFENAPIGIGIIKRDGNISLVNKPGVQILGFSTPEELYRENIGVEHFLSPEMLDLVNKNLLKLQKTKKNEICEYQITDYNGRPKCLETQITMLEDKDDQVDDLVVFARDVTYKRRMERKLLENEIKYRMLVDTSPLGIALIEISGIITQCNDMLAKMFGYKDKESLLLSNRNIIEFISKEHRKMATRDVNSLISLGYSTHKEYTMVAVDGNRFDVEVNASLFTNEDDKVVAFTVVFRDITQEKQIKEKLIESEKRYRTLAEAARDIIFIIDKSDNITYVNDFAASQFGSTPELMVGRPRSEFFDHGVSKRQHSHLQTAMNNGVTLYYEHQADLPNKELWLGTQLVPLINDNGEFYSVLGIARNITERKRIEHELIESKERYRILVENQGDLVIKLDLDGTLLFVSSMFCDTFGKPEEELLELNVLSLVYDDDRERTREAIENLVNPPYRCEVEYRVLTVNGILWFSWVYSAIMDESNNVSKIIGVGRNISKQKEMEAELRASEERFRELAELLPEVVFEMDTKGNLTFINQYAFELSGYSKSDFTSEINVISFITPEDRPRFRKNMVEIENGKSDLRSEYTIVRKDGVTIPVIARSTPIIHENKVVGLRGIIIDVSKVREAEQALIESEKQFRDSIERSIDGYYFVTTEGVVKDLNAAAEKIIGYRKHEINDHLVKGLNDNIKFQELLRFYNQVMGGKKILWKEFKFIDKMGNPVWIGLNARRVMEKGIVKGVEGFIKNVTKQKNAENEIKNSEARYRSLFKNIPYEVFSLNLHGYFKETNNLFVEKWGRVQKTKPEQTISENSFVDAIQFSIRKMEQTKKSIEKEFRVKNDENEIIYRLIMSPVITSENDILGYIGMNIDITDQVEAINLSRQFSAQLVRFQEEEREQLAREIHDSLGQMLTALQFEISAATASLNTNRNHAEKMLTESKSTLDQAIVEVRNLYSDLRPQLLDDFGIDVALRDFGKDFQEKWNVEVNMKTMPVSKFISKEAAISLYRITQEALNNILKYSHATQVFVELLRKNEHIVLIIKDNGIGFDLDFTSTNDGVTHFGLIGMKERIDILGGEFKIESELEQGTQITAIIPITNIVDSDG